MTGGGLQAAGLGRRGTGTESSRSRFRSWSRRRPPAPRMRSPVPHCARSWQRWSASV